MRKNFLALVTCHTQSLALLHMSLFFAKALNSSPTATVLVVMVASHHRFNREDALGTWKAIGRGLASDQLRMHAISKHTNLF
jgi:hypothetical protein